VKICPTEIVGSLTPVGVLERQKLGNEVGVSEMGAVYVNLR